MVHGVGVTVADQIHDRELGRTGLGEGVAGCGRSGLDSVAGCGRSGLVGATVRRVAGDGRAECIEQHQQSAPAGVHHAGLGQHRELIGCALQCDRGGLAGTGEHLGQTGALGGCLSDRLCGGLQYRHHGAVHHLTAHCRHHQHDCMAQCRGQQCGIDIGQIAVGQIGIGLGLRHHIGKPAQDLRQDHPGIATRAIGCAPRQRRRHLSDIAGGCRRFRLDQRRAHGEQHVGAGVGISHREDVEPVDLIGVAQQVTDGGVGPVVQGSRVQPPVRHRHLLIPDTL